MSDAREVAGPPPRRGGAANLIKGNRGAVTVEPAKADEVVDSSRVIAAPPPAPRAAHMQTIASPPEPVTNEAELGLHADAPALRPEILGQAALPSTNAETAPPTPHQPANQSTPVIPSTPYTRKRGIAPSTESPDDIVKVTFEIRRGDRDAFNAAFGAANMKEGYVTPKDLLQDIYMNETRRLEIAYNDGQPFPRRNRGAVRGRPFVAD